MPFRQVICLEQSEQIHRWFVDCNYDLAMCRCCLCNVAAWNQRRYALFIFTVLSAITLLQRFKSLFTMWIHSMVRASIKLSNSSTLTRESSLHSILRPPHVSGIFPPHLSESIWPYATFRDTAYLSLTIIFDIIVFSVTLHRTAIDAFVSQNSALLRTIRWDGTIYFCVILAGNIAWLFLALFARVSSASHISFFHS